MRPLNPRISTETRLLSLHFKLWKLISHKKNLGQVDFKSRCSGNGVVSGGGSSARPDLIYNRCGNKFHNYKEFKSNGNETGGDSYEIPMRNIPVWVTMNTVIYYVKYLETATMNCNKSKYKWCISCNGGNGVWVLHWESGHNYWK